MEKLGIKIIFIKKASFIILIFIQFIKIEGVLRTEYFLKWQINSIYMNIKYNFSFNIETLILILIALSEIIWVYILCSKKTNKVTFFISSLLFIAGWLILLRYEGGWINENLLIISSIPTILFFIFIFTREVYLYFNTCVIK